MHNISKREKLTYTGSLLGQNMIYSFEIGRAHV